MTEPDFLEQLAQALSNMDMTMQNDKTYNRPFQREPFKKQLDRAIKLFKARRSIVEREQRATANGK